MTSNTRTLETRYYDNGEVLARLYKSDDEPDEEEPDVIDHHYDFIGKDEDYESLNAWIAELEIETDDIVLMVLKLEDGEWVDITDYVRKGDVQCTWTPMLLTDSSSGRKVHCSILEAELYKAGTLSFDDLWDAYKDDLCVQLMNHTMPSSQLANRGETI